MSSKYCSACPQKLPLSCFLKDALASPTSRVYSTCIQCRDKRKKASNKKRTALQSIDPNIRPAKRTCTSHICPQPIVQAPIPQVLPIEPPLPPNPPAEPLLPQALVTDGSVPVTDQPPTESTGFLPTDEWRQIQDFNRAMEDIQMETCQRCQEHGFAMDLKGSICHRCFLRDTDNRKQPVTPFLMSAENHIDPGVVPSYLLELSQVEEMVIARAYVQMLVKRVRGHQYQYTGHCVAFMQNIVRTVDMLPNLPSELDIVLLRPPEGSTDDDGRYRRQFRTDFRVCRQCVLT
jgi:hypothetical protein